ncbi:MAG: epoxyqueuosine reductase, partial [Oscillospiraceae bacterium]
MDYKELFEREAAAFIENYPGNTITEDVALTPDMAGLKICDAPIFNYGDANDAMFETFLKEGIIGPHHFMPHQWLPSAKSVISFFLPYTAQVRTANKRHYTRPATEWLHARIEGQEVV